MIHAKLVAPLLVGRLHHRHDPPGSFLRRRHRRYPPQETYCFQKRSSEHCDLCRTCRPKNYNEFIFTNEECINAKHYSLHSQNR
jgi:hypothetical protein